MKIVNIVGARPNFIKIAPLMKAMKKQPEMQSLLVHTGQHYDAGMAGCFFQDLDIPSPDVFLEVGSGSHAVSDFLFVTEESAEQHLLAEGISRDKVFFVGNVMIDCLESSRQLWTSSTILKRLHLNKGRYGVVTLHRPSNVDNVQTLERLVEALSVIAQRCPLIFPVHPRTIGTLKSLERFRSCLHFENGEMSTAGIRCIAPLGYLDFMALVEHSRIVLTDSGGLQEETTVLGIPCLTLRENTERPVTVTHGTNRIVGSSPSRIVTEAACILDAPRNAPVLPPLWDGHASERIVAILRGEDHAGT